MQFVGLTKALQKQTFYDKLLIYFFSKIYGLSMEELYTGEDKEKRVAKFSRTFDELSNKSQREVLEFIEFKRKLEEK